MRRRFSDSDTPAAIEVGGQMYKGRSSECFRDCPFRRAGAGTAAAENIGAIGPGSALSLRRSLAEAEQGADALADVFRGGPPCPLVFSTGTRDVSARRKLYAKAGWRGRVSRQRPLNAIHLRLGS